jgi:hypothetical protein
MATTRSEPICTAGSNKHELNLSKARSAGAISMSLFVPLLVFNQNSVNAMVIMNDRAKKNERCDQIE